jgi:DeoR family transcriptional regulator, fructose operon transcriptional repressor
VSVAAYQRRQKIEAIVAREQFASVSELARAMGSSPLTVRRDIELLDASHRVRKIHGGAISVLDANAMSANQVLPVPIAANRTAIARAALSVVVPHTSVALNAGPGATDLAEQLADVEGLTVVTNSLAVAAVVERTIADRGQRWVDLIVTGGSRMASGALVGPTAITALAQINPVLLLLSVDGVDESMGLSTDDVLEAEVNRAFLVSAQQTAIVFSNAQWGTVGLNLLGPIGRARSLVTDVALGTAVIEKLGVGNVELVRA